MTAPRRKVLRRAPPSTVTTIQESKAAKYREYLDYERGSLKKWVTKLRPAFNTVERVQGRINRLQKKLAALQHS